MHSLLRVNSLLTVPLYFRPKFVAGVSNSVSFRQGTNVEFEGPSFKDGGAGEAGAADNRDFSNPMYDMQSGGGLGGGAGDISSQAAPPTINHKELSPVSLDTGKDTQCLVEDDSEC